MHSERHEGGRCDRGFTLVEMLIVIIVLGVVATVVVFAVRGIVDDSDDAAVGTDRRTLTTAQEAYYAENGSYASEADLVTAGLIREPSTLHDIAIGDDGSYTIVASSASATPSSGDANNGGGGSDGGAPTVGGRVVNAIDDQPIRDALVCVLGTALCDVTDHNGEYSLTELTAGGIVVEFTADGFVGLEEATTVADGETTVHNAALSPDLAAGELRIVLEWDAHPGDLDSHLWLPAGDAYHVFYQNQGDVDVAPFAHLDVDASGGFGPETITLAQRADGVYTYAVHNYSGGPGLTGSGAVVRVYNSGGLFREFDVPAVGAGTWWHVFDLDGTTGTITAVDALRATSPAPY